MINIIFWIVIIVAVILFITWPTFRTFIMNQGANIVSIAANFVRLYSIAALVVLGVVALLVLTGLFIPVGVYKGLAFGLAASLVYAIWLPAGIILRIFRVTKDTFPSSIKAVAAWLCFIGFLGVLYPDTTSNFKLVLLVALAAGVFSGMTVKINALEKLVFPIVVILLIVTGIKYVFPETYRSNTAFLKAIGGAENTAVDRGRLRIKSYSTATYGHMKKDVQVAYLKSTSDTTALRDINVNLKKDDVFLLVSHKNETFEYNGQGFVEICLPKTNGSYINGKKMWVEVDLVEIGSRADIELDSESNDTEPVEAVNRPSAPELLYYNDNGAYLLPVLQGQTSSWIVVGNCHTYNFSHDNIILEYEDGSSVNVAQIAHLPDKAKFRVTNLDERRVKLLIGPA